LKASAAARECNARGSSQYLGDTPASKLTAAERHFHEIHPPRLSRAYSSRQEEVRAEERGVIGSHDAFAVEQKASPTGLYP
jgi:hypothetical protein